MPRYAIVDLGSNTIRLVIFDVDGKNLDAYRTKGKARSKPSKLFSEILDEKKTAGLSAYVVDGVFSNKGIAKAAEIIGMFLKNARDLDCKHTSVFATAVLRNCSNSKEAKATIEKAIDHKIDLLSEREEAHLGFVGAQLDKAFKQGTLIDIGGGSTELTLVRDGVDHLNASIPQGSVSSYAKFVKRILPTNRELRSIAKAMCMHLQELGEPTQFQSAHAYGIGGSIRGLCKLYGELFNDGKKVSTITIGQIESVIAELDRHPSDFAHALTKSASDRIHTVMPGTIIVQTIMHMIGAEDLEVCKYGIREGYLMEKVLGL